MAMMTVNGIGDQQTVIGLAEGRTTSVWDTHTAIVNLVQSASQENANIYDREIYTTEPPSTACLGIAKLIKTKAIYFLDGMRLCKLDPKRTDNIPQVEIIKVTGLVNNETINMPDQLSLDLSIPIRRVTRARTWYQKVREFYALPQQQPALISSFDRRVSRGVAPLPMPGVPLAGGGGLMRPEYADELFMTLAYTIAARGWGVRRQAMGVGAGHHIAAVLASRTGAIYGWGVNYNSIDSTRHAETNLIQSLNRQIPPDATLYTTLQSCFMCAGLFVHADGRRCVYGQRDHNMDGNTALAAREEIHAGGRFSRRVVVGPHGPQEASESMGQHLETKRVAMLPSNGSVNLVPNYLNTLTAEQTYSFAEERLVNLARAATGSAEKTAWRNIVALLQVQGLSLPPNLILGDESRPLF